MLLPLPQGCAPRPRVQKRKRSTDKEERLPCARIFGRIDEGGGSSIPVEMEMLLSLWLPSVALGLPLSLSLTTISKLITDSDIRRIICVCLVVRFFVWSALLPQRVCCSQQCAMPVQHVKVSEQAQEHTSPGKNKCDKQVSSWRHISCHTDKIRCYT